MSNKLSLNPYLISYSEASSSGDFNRLFDSLSQLSFEDYLRFIKRSSCYQFHAKYRVKINGSSKTKHVLSPEYFWNSSLTLRWAKELFCSENAEELLFGFFSKTENYNQQLLEAISHHNPMQLIRSVKLKKCFLEDELFSKLFFMKISVNPLLVTFYKEIEALKRLDEEWLEKKVFYESVFDLYSVEEIIVHTVSYFEKFKRSSTSHLGNNGHLISIQACLIRVLNWILNERRKKGCNVEASLSIPDIYSLISREMPPLNTPEGVFRGLYLPHEPISDTKRLIREALEFYFSYIHGFLYQVDKYCVGFADVIDIAYGKIKLVTNDDFQNYKRDEKKISFLQYYFTYLANESPELKEKSKNAMDINERQMDLTNAAYMKHFEFMKVGVIKHNKYEIAPNELINFLWNLSTWLMPQGRTILVAPEEETEEGTWMRPVTFTRKIPDEFKKAFPQEYVVAFDYKSLLNACSQYFRWEEHKCAALIDYLTLNMSDAKGNFDILEYPLIKIGSNYFWMSTFLRDRNWFNILSARFQREIHQRQSQELEVAISNLFSDAGFSAKASVKFKDDELREIDCIAYKDGCLFIVELKTTYPSEDLIRQSEFNSRKLEHKAVNQLERIIEHYESNFQFFKDLEGLNIDREQKDIAIYPLIVTNTFERDKILWDMKYLKVSLFELTIALKNDLYKMLNSNLSTLFPEETNFGEFELSFQMMESASNPNNPFLRQESIDTSREACDLYDGGHITAFGFADVIAQDKVWQFLDYAYDFDIVESITLKNYDKNYQWLS